jgi:uncharacterized repeat protein (TIGR01451 family)
VGGNGGHSRHRRTFLITGATVAALVVFAAVGSARAPQAVTSATFTAVDAPDPVSAGLTASYTFEARNNGRGTLANATVVDDLPAGASFVSASPTVGSCSHSAGRVTCNLGTIGSGGSAKVKILFAAPSTPFQNCAQFTAKETRRDSDKGFPVSLNACQSSQVRAANDPNFRAGCIGGGSALSTGTTATATDRQTTALKVPGEACVTLAEVLPTGPSDGCGTGFTCKTDISEIQHPPCPANNPCVITVTFDSSFGTITRLFYNGVLVQPCANPAVASPDPCLLSRTLISGRIAPAGRFPLHGVAKDTRFVVLSAIDARMRGG